MRVDKLEVLNLWDEPPFSIPFEKRVTFLTGANGSGKSTILNILYDTLNRSKQVSIPSTSKNRLWSAQAEVSWGVGTAAITAMFVPSEIDEDALNRILESNKGNYHSEDLIKSLERILDLPDKPYKKFVPFDKELQLEYCVESFYSQKKEDHDFFSDKYDGKNLSYLFQPDRVFLSLLHKGDSISGRSDFYTKFYSNAMDDRLHYIRNYFHSYESQARSEFLDAILSKSNPPKKEKKDELSAKIEEIRDFIELLDKYFLEIGKQVKKDENGRISLKRIDSDVELSWELLSRGEKTILYLFMAVFLYRNKNHVFLLDEPDDSLHVSWQKKLIRDLSDLAPECQFIIATHSPALVQDGWMGNCVELKISKG